MAKRSRTAAREAAQRRLTSSVHDRVEASWGGGWEPSLESLARLRAQRNELDEDLSRVHAAIGEEVIRARAEGETWASIGASLGLTGQAAGLIHRRALERR